MSDKLIDLNALSAYKTSSDAEYQDKLIAGAGITISGNTISASGGPTFSGDLISGSQTLSTNTLTKISEITLQPGNYFIMYTCQFASNANGYRQCGFSTSTSDITGFGWAFMDSQNAVNGSLTQTRVSRVFEVSASDYPNGRKFYFLARHNCGVNLTAYPRAMYLKF